MVTLLFSLASLLFLSATSTAAVTRDDVVLKLMQHVERLDTKIEQLEHKHGIEIEALKESSKLWKAEYIGRIDILDQRVADLQQENEEMTKAQNLWRTPFSEDLNEKKTEDDLPEKDVKQNAEKFHDNIRKRKANGKIRPNAEETMDAAMTKPRRALQTDYNIAFTVYMDHDVNNVGVGQALIYNQILLNDGNGYNIHSGMFTAPVAGVYSFTFFIAQRDYNDAGAALYVNSDNKVDAIVETDVSTEDAQGGNSAALKVAAGDVVYVKYTFGRHLEGSKGGRYTTFSGFLLYPTEGDTVAVGK